MYKINESLTSIERLEEKSLSSLHVDERQHFQEWIASQPEALSEDLLIIQKEFSGFNNTNERPDLLALDKQGALVIIENKIKKDKNVLWQGLRYASYFSGFSKANIADIYQEYLDKTESGANAKKRISEFMGDKDFEDIMLNTGVTQRIILIAPEFTKEVKHAALWLLNFKINLQCFRATAFSEKGGESFLNIEQIIPIQDAKEFMIGIAEKAQDDIENQAKQRAHQKMYQEFWSKLIQEMNDTDSSLYQNISPITRHWINAGSGVSGITFNFGVTKTDCQAGLYIGRSEKRENDLVFDKLHGSKSVIEEKFGASLEWLRLDEKNACRILATSDGNVFDRDQWDKMIVFMTDAMCRLEAAIKEPLKDAGDQLKKGFLPG